MTNTQHTGTVQQASKPETLQEQLRIIQVASSDGIALIDANNRIVEANNAFSNIFGLDSTQQPDIDCAELLRGKDNNTAAVEDPSGHVFTIQKALEQHQTLPYVEIDLSITALSRSIGLTITPLTTADQPLSLLIVRDVTAMRETVRLKSNFLSMITHELRSPLNAIHGYLDLALSGIGGELNQQQQEFVQRARSSSEHLYALIEDLLLVSRADSGQARLNRALVSLQEIVADAIEELELMATDNGIDIIVDIPHDFPPIYADAVRVQQVLRNLISNALRFTPSGGNVTISATTTNRLDNDQSNLLSAAESGRLLKLDVRDTGHGIAMEQQQRIFERFYQVPQPASSRSNGLGLGLAIVKMIVEMHGGQVSVTSSEGQGSTFTCLLPCLLS
ncbi:MAG TPA: PAS domain-containing sensor histidine kinase [Ktedonobacteraceae bacterium]